MLLPRFSIRWVLMLTTVLALLFVAVRQAFLGQSWAIGLTAVLVFVTIAFIFYACAFLAAYALARATRSLHPPEVSENPFVVEGQYPPQMVPKNPQRDQQ